jgi:hypothetical protein
MSINCEHCRNAFEEMLDGTLTPAMAAEVNRHLQLCAACQDQLDTERTIRHALSQLAAPPMRADFPSEVMARVRHQAEKSSYMKHKGFIAGFGSAIAASLVLWFVVTLTSMPQEGNQMLQTVSLSLGETRQVNLVFDSPEEFGQTTFALLLPDNAELEGYPGRHEFTWTASLRKGKNRLTLPIRVAAPGDGEIVARISQSDAVKVFKLKLDVREQSGAGLVLRNLT